MIMPFRALQLQQQRQFKIDEHKHEFNRLMEATWDNETHKQTFQLLYQPLDNELPPFNLCSMVYLRQFGELENRVILGYDIKTKRVHSTPEYLPHCDYWFYNDNIGDGGVYWSLLPYYNISFDDFLLELDVGIDLSSNNSKMLDHWNSIYEVWLQLDRKPRLTWVLAPHSGVDELELQYKGINGVRVSINPDEDANRVKTIYTKHLVGYPNGVWLPYSHVMDWVDSLDSGTKVAFDMALSIPDVDDVTSDVECYVLQVISSTRNLNHSFERFHESKTHLFFIDANRVSGTTPQIDETDSESDLENAESDESDDDVDSDNSVD